MRLRAGRRTCLLSDLALNSISINILVHPHATQFQTKPPLRRGHAVALAHLVGEALAVGRQPRLLPTQSRPDRAQSHVMRQLVVNGLLERVQVERLPGS